MLMEKRSFWMKLLKIIEDQYNKASETKDMIVDGNDFISFTNFFKYVGSFISYDLSDEYDIKVRSKKANQSMGVLIFLGKQMKQIYGSGYLIYMAISIILLLWGCESWSLTKKLKKLEVFNSRCVTKFLKIKWNDIMDEKITNKNVQKDSILNSFPATEQEQD